MQAFLLWKVIQLNFLERGTAPFPSLPTVYNISIMTGEGAPELGAQNGWTEGEGTSAGLGKVLRLILMRDELKQAVERLEN